MHLVPSIKMSPTTSNIILEKKFQNLQKQKLFSCRNLIKKKHKYIQQNNNGKSYESYIRTKNEENIGDPSKI